ncbi:hypothetical protein CDAR_50461 [Caerostris darwini]|uniref:Uncharacterized protein n=1 Tax=Caerostris darwini TaxID=1538125 RepID=A0AAV4UXM6_9ARAC|nr:hypothetical protein CDAR_50461 [Caerostris darwini]
MSVNRRHRAGLLSDWIAHWRCAEIGTGKLSEESALCCCCCGLSHWIDPSCDQMHNLAASRFHIVHTYLEGFNIDFLVVINKVPSEISVSLSESVSAVVVAYLFGSIHHAIKRIAPQLQDEEEHIAASRRTVEM